MTLADNINRAIADFDSIKNAIENKGVDVGTAPTSEYADKISQIETGDDYYDIFWDTFQQNGERTGYATVFADGYFNKETFKPKYDIKPTSCQNMFTSFPDECDLREILNTCGVVLDFSSGMMGNYAFSRSKFTALPTLNSPYGYYQWFSNCSLLHTIDKIVFNRNMTVDNLSAFSYCTALQNIVIEGEIGASFNIRFSPLTVESAKSIITHLVKYTGTENEYVYSLTLSTTTLDLLEAEGDTSPNGNSWIEYVGSLGWNT